MNTVLGIIKTVLDDGHMDDGNMMGGFWGGSFMWFWMLFIWLIFLVIAGLVYRDAEKRGKNGLLWFVLIIIPWVGILSLIIYLIIREEKNEDDQSQKGSEQILDERYARGDIARMEYLRIKNDLNSGG